MVYGVLGVGSAQTANMRAVGGDGIQSALMAGRPTDTGAGIIAADGGAP